LSERTEAGRKLHLLRLYSDEAGVMPVERREQATAFGIGSTGNGKNPVFEWKAAAFARWHEPDDARVSSPESVRGSG
jgi:hypothetical protein